MKAAQGIDSSGGATQSKTEMASRILMAGLLILPSVAFSRSPVDLAEFKHVSASGIFRANVRIDDTGNLMDARGSNPKAFILENGTIYTIWADGRAAPGTMDQDDIYFAKSNDGGLSYSSNIPIAVTSNLSGGIADIDVTQDGAISVIWGERSLNPVGNHIFYSRSVDGGSIFSSPVVVDGHAWNESCMADHVAISSYGNVLFIAWTQLIVDPFGSGVFLAQSNDGGMTWGSPKRIDDAGADELNGFDMAVDIDGVIYVVWIDYATGEARLQTSMDSGLSFGPSTVLSSLNWTTIQVAVAARQAQEAFVAWSATQNPSGNTSTLFMSRVLEGGKTLLSPTKVTDIPQSTSRIQDPSIAVDGRSHVFVTWSDSRNDSWGDVYLARSLDGGQSFESNLRIVDTPLNDGASQVNSNVAVNENGSLVVVWSDYRRDVSRFWGGDIYSAVPTYIPDLSVQPSDISWHPSLPAVGILVAVNATIRNIGWGYSDLTVARFHDGNPPSPQIGADQALPPIAVGENVTASITWVAQQPGMYEICAVADPDDLITELSETNNIACNVIDVFYSVHLTPGHRLMSFPMAVSNDSVSSVLSSISGCYDYVRWYDPLDSSDHWKSYVPGRTYNDLTRLDDTMGFWINVTASCDFTLSGTRPVSTTIDLHQGWNMIGFPSFNTTYTVADLKADIGLAGVIVEAFDANAGPYYLQRVSDSCVMKTGEGYWVFVPSDAAWTVGG